jgi:hypothetical protein
MIALVVWFYASWSEVRIPVQEITNDVIPTIHARCSDDTICGSEMVCDIYSRRCKKTLDGQCASDVDCQHGLHCVNWICIDNGQPESPNINIRDVKSKAKRVRWKYVLEE